MIDIVRSKCILPAAVNSVRAEVAGSSRGHRGTKLRKCHGYLLSSISGGLYFHTAVTDPGLEHNDDLSNLQELNLRGTIVTQEAVDKLR